MVKHLTALAITGLIVILITLAGCQKKTSAKVIHSLDAGVVIEAQVIPTSWNETPKTMIQTTTGSFVIMGVTSVMKGGKASITLRGDGRQYFCVEGWSHCMGMY